MLRKRKFLISESLNLKYLSQIRCQVIGLFSLCLGEVTCKNVNLIRSRSLVRSMKFILIAFDFYLSNLNLSALFTVSLKSDFKMTFYLNESQLSR